MDKFCEYLHNITKLQLLLLTMDIPESKFELANKPENIRWLARNISIRNSKHKDIEQAIELIKLLLKFKLE